MNNKNVCSEITCGAGWQPAAGGIRLSAADGEESCRQALSFYLRLFASICG
jgi:hypothetical protein